METRLIYITAGNMAEARKIAKELVESRLAACANIIEKMTSIYRWKDRLQEDTEVILIAKTTLEKVAPLIERVEAIHSYDCPCILSLPIENGNQAFLDWIAEEVAPPRNSIDPEAA